MLAPSFFYRIISRVAAVILLVAGVLKARDFLIPPALAPQWTVLGQAALELLLGVWLLVGLYPRWSRLVALVCFFVFLNVALAGAFEGKATCGCFGKVSVRPWSAVGLDGLLFVGLLFSPATQMQETAPRMKQMRWGFFSISAFLVLLAFGWPSMGKISSGEKRLPTIVSEDVPSGIDESALEQVIQGVERNHAALHILVCTTEKALTQYPVKWTGTRPMRKGNQIVHVTGTWIEPETEKQTKYVWKTWIRGDEVRQDGITYSDGSPTGDILLSSKGKRIQYSPRSRQAWISEAERADSGYLESIDLRCAGFLPPLMSIADWLKNRCEVLNAGLAKDRRGREVVRIRVRMKKNSKEEFEVIADFVPDMNYLPERVIHFYFPNGGLSSVMEIEYQQVGSEGAWFPRRITQRGFNPNTTSDPDAHTGQSFFQESTINVMAFGQGVQDEDFDPILPENTLLLGNLALQTKTDNAPIRASEMTRMEPRIVTKDATTLHQASAPRTTFWVWLAVTDLLLLGSCLLFRKRLAF